MKTLDQVLACLIFVMGVVHGATTFKLYKEISPHALWSFGASLATNPQAIAVCVVMAVTTALSFRR